MPLAAAAGSAAVQRQIAPSSPGLAFTNQQSASMTNSCLQLSLAENKANLHMLNLN